MNEPFRPCAVVPTFDNPATVRGVVEGIRVWLDDMIVVDDASTIPVHQVIESLGSPPGVHLHRRKSRGGKGAAVKDGLRIAHGLGYSHALQVDADGQHALDDIPSFLDAARSQPNALILGSPRFDSSAPRTRLVGRQITRFWTAVETYGTTAIEDPMCGFRVYPILAAIRAAARGNAMDFDPEVAVRMVWQAVPVVNLPTRIRYRCREEGGVSHFRMVRDNALISLMHTRLVIEALFRLASRS